MIDFLLHVFNSVFFIVVAIAIDYQFAAVTLTYVDLGQEGSNNYVFCAD